MALPNLATSADLSARGVSIADTALVSTMLAVASSVVRAAAQSPILETDSTVTLWAVDGDQYLDLPGMPVTDVASVTLDGETLDEDSYKLVVGRLWRSAGWGGCEPLEVEVDLTHGFPEVPAYIKNLVCDLAIAGMASASSGAHDPRVIAEKIDDYAVTFVDGADSVATAMELPRLTRDALRKKFGGGVALVLSR